MGVLPVDVDQLFVNVFYYFYHSSKRKQEFCDLWCSLFTSEPQTVLKHCTTRWLSLLRCVGWCISQFDGLMSYFRSCSEAETSRVVSILQRLENPLTKPLLHFLSLFFHQWISSIVSFRSPPRIQPVSCTRKCLGWFVCMPIMF